MLTLSAATSLAWPMALGAIAGGYAGALAGRKLPRPVVRWFVIVVGLALSAYEFARRLGFGTSS